MARDEVTVVFTRKQALWVAGVLGDKQEYRGSRGVNFGAWRRVRRALGTWSEPKHSGASGRPLCHHPRHNNPGLITPCPECGDGA